MYFTLYVTQGMAMPMSVRGPSTSYQQEEEDEEPAYEDAYTVVNDIKTSSNDIKTSSNDIKTSSNDIQTTSNDVNTDIKLYRLCTVLVCVIVVLMFTFATSGVFVIKQLSSLTKENEDINNSVQTGMKELVDNLKQELADEIRDLKRELQTKVNCLFVTLLKDPYLMTMT